MGRQRLDPSEDNLLEAFGVLDKEGNGRISEKQFRRIMEVKLVGEIEELDEMLEEYRRRHAASEPVNPKEERFINYRDFVAMLQP